MAKTLLYFTAPWCQPCKTFGPIIDAVAEDYPYDKVDVDQNPQAAVEWNIRQIPTVVLLENSTELARFTGVRTESQLREFIDSTSYEDWVKANGEKPVLVEG